jgi:subtilisin family serine protease
MSSYIQSELEARGVAQVIVVLRPETPAVKAGSAIAAGPTEARHVPGLARLATHFEAAETSQASQLATAAKQGRPLRPAVRVGRARKRAPVKVPAARYYPHLGILMGTTSREGLAALRSDKRVARVVAAPAFSLIRPSFKALARLTTTLAWGIQALKADRLWKEGLTGTGVLIGHLDTGADGKHPALKGAIAHFAEFDDFGRPVQPAPSPFDSDDHGTHTAATIAGRAVKGRHVGLAPGARLASAVVIEGGDVLARVLGGMDWAVGRKVRVLSMSLGLRGWWDDFVVLTRILRQRGVLPVFAVGNEGPGTSRSPGNYPEALSVGAHDDDWKVADFSSSQRFRRATDPLVPDLVAPGVGVISAMPGGRWQIMDGTSMATPHVAGLAALLMEAAPDRSIDMVESAIFRSCLRRGMNVERCNRGVPDGLRALKFLREA